MTSGRTMSKSDTSLSSIIKMDDGKWRRLGTDNYKHMPYLSVLPKDSTPKVYTLSFGKEVKDAKLLTQGKSLPESASRSNILSRSWTTLKTNLKSGWVNIATRGSAQPGIYINDKEKV